MVSVSASGVMFASSQNRIVDVVVQNNVSYILLKQKQKQKKQQSHNHTHTHKKIFRFFILHSISQRHIKIIAQMSNGPHSFDVLQFAGKRFQLASIPNWFQPVTSRNVTAEYLVEVNEDDEQIVVVRNEQTTADGRQENITGVATIASVEEKNKIDKNASAALTVSFFNGQAKAQAISKADIHPDAPRTNTWLGYIGSIRTIWPAVITRIKETFKRPNLIVYAVGLKDNDVSAPYTWILVGSPDRSSGWILSDTLTLSCPTWRTIRAEMLAHGFDQSKFVLTGHVCY